MTTSPKDRSATASPRRAASLSFAVALAVALAAPTPVSAEETDAAADAVVSPLRLAPASGLAVRELTVSLSLAAEERAWTLANSGPTPVSTLLALGLPRLDAARAALDGVIRARAPDFVGVAVTVDAAPAPLAVDVRASRLGVDLTERLKADGLPLSPWTAPDAEARLAALAPDRRAFWSDRGLVDWDGAVVAWDWDVATTLHWAQTVPAGGAVTVTARHAPTVGLGLLTAVSLDRRLARPDCAVDAATRAALRKALAPAAGDVSTSTALMSRRLRLALVEPDRPTLPIGRLAVTLTTPTPTTLVVACGPLAPRRAGPTTVVLEATNLTPTADLDLILVDPGTTP